MFYQILAVISIQYCGVSESVFLRVHHIVYLVWGRVYT